MHVSAKILWIAPAVDITFCLAFAVVIYVAALIFRRLPPLRTLGFVLTFFAVYDWLRLTNRIFPAACILFALGCGVAAARWARPRERNLPNLLRWSWLAAAGTVLIIAAATETGPRVLEQRRIAALPPPQPGAPNVVVIVIDTLRADHVSSYGYSRPTTPAMDAIAHQGVLFENAIAPCSWSLPSHASLLTGRYPHEHGVQNVQPEPWLGWGKTGMGGYPTIGEALQARGYRTAAFSANRVYFTRNVGLGRGFLHFEDYFYSVGDSLVRTVYGRTIWHRFFNRSEKSAFTRALRYLGLDAWLDKDSEGSGDFGGAYGVRKRANEVNRETLAWVGNDRQRPFFAFLNYLDVHYSYGGPRYSPKPAWDQGSAIDEYDAGLKYVDDSIADLVTELKQRGFENTLFVITSDHGESLGDHGLTYHGASLYRELIRVPLIIRFPGHVPGGVRIEQPVSNAAVARTVLEIIGFPDERFPGPPLNQFWQGRDQTVASPNPLSDLARTDVIVPQDRLMQGRIPIATDGDMTSIYSSRWHLIHHQVFGDQLYDMGRDPGELKDEAHSDTGRNVIFDLRAGKR